MAAANPVVAEMACTEPSCSVTVYVRKTSTGKLSYTCARCSGSEFAEPGGGRFRAWSSRMQPIEGATPPAPAPDNPPPTAPAPAPRAGGFVGLGL